MSRREKGEGEVHLLGGWAQPGTRAFHKNPMRVEQGGRESCILVATR